jgi:hypothetical protein
MMEKIKFLLKFYGWKSFVELVTLLIIGFIQVISMFSESFKNSPQFEYIFRITILIILGQIFFKLISLSQQKSVDIEVVKKDNEAKNKIFQVVKRHDIKKAIILSSGLSSRIDFIESLANEGLELEILYQCPDFAPDKNDAPRINQSLSWIKENIKNKKCKFIDFKQPASIRCIILYDIYNNPCFAQVGWYTYTIRDDGTIKVIGSQNPSLLISNEGTYGKELLLFLEEKIKEYKINKSDSVTSL